MNGLIIQPREGGCTFSIQVVPRAGQSRIAGLMNGVLKIRIAAPPVDGAANEECIKFLSRLFRIPKSSVSLLAGEHRRKKVIFLRGVSLQEARERLGGSGSL